MTTKSKPIYKVLQNLQKRLDSSEKLPHKLDLCIELTNELIAHRCSVHVLDSWQLTKILLENQQLKRTIKTQEGRI